MEGAVRYFDRYELFQNKDRQPQRPDAHLRSVATQVDEWYDNFWDVALKYNDGNLQAAEHFMDTSVFMYYYRVKQKAAWVDWHNEEMKKVGEKG
ncbi:MAG: hypothetical protein R2800_08130 [Flavipsychrobacter sp.]